MGTRRTSPPENFLSQHTQERSPIRWKKRRHSKNVNVWADPGELDNGAATCLLPFSVRVKFGLCIFSVSSRAGERMYMQYRIRRCTRQYASSFRSRLGLKKLSKWPRLILVLLRQYVRRCGTNVALYVWCYQPRSNHVRDMWITFLSTSSTCVLEVASWRFLPLDPTLSRQQSRSYQNFGSDYLCNSASNSSFSHLGGG